MALTGHLSDLSLSELIEFFCNQRKTGSLKVQYPQGPGYFYLQTGSVVDAQVGTLRGIDAVYYALTLPNASFEFNGSAEVTERTINQPWTQVVLEGLRRLDEGLIPPEAFPEGFVAEGVADSQSDSHKTDAASAAHVSHVPAFLSRMNPESIGKRKPLIAGAAAFAVLVSVAAIGVPAGWYGRSKPAAAARQSGTVTAPAASVVNDPANKVVAPGVADTDAHAADAAALAAKRLRDKKAREERANAGNASVTPAPTPQNAGGDKPGQKKVTVQVTYDESGRVVQASGADATAIRIARQKRFPPGKAGTATITIPIN